MNNPSILQIKNLTVSFKSEEAEVKAVDSVNFFLNRGETLGIVGESGSGKSVTSLSTMRLVPTPPGKLSGSIIYSPEEGKEVDLLALSQKEMRRYRGSEIAMIFQEPMTSLNPVYTCGEQVTEAIRQHNDLSKKAAREKTIELFKEVQLPRPEEMFSSFPHQLSGGQKQRVMIAMAISCNPHVLIADEPTTALDVTVQAHILQLLQQIQQEKGMSMIFITHDLGVVAEIADRVVVMYKGKIVEQGPVREIFTNPKHPYTKGLLACRPPLDKRLTRLPSMEDFVNAGEDVTGKDFSVDEMHRQLEVKSEEITARRKKLYKEGPLLRVENLQTYFPVRKGLFKKVVDHVKAVDNVSFEVFAGETLGLVGESGCGKTTLGRTILRLIEPTGGKIVYKDRELTSLSKSEMRALRKQMQIIFQDPYSSLNPRMTIGAAILEPMQVHGLHQNDKQRKQRVLELLERVGMKPEHYNRYPHEFSGGQRQRICIARALAVSPDFIICDESVSALDVSVQAQVLNLLNELQREFGLTYIFISHDLSVVKFFSDRLIVMSKGKIEEIGHPEDIYGNPQSEYTKQLIAAIPKGEIGVR